MWIFEKLNIAYIVHTFKLKLFILNAYAGDPIMDVYDDDHKVVIVFNKILILFNDYSITFSSFMLTFLRVKFIFILFFCQSTIFLLY